MHHLTSTSVKALPQEAPLLAVIYWALIQSKDPNSSNKASAFSLTCGVFPDWIIWALFRKRCRFSLASMSTLMGCVLWGNQTLELGHILWNFKSVYSWWSKQKLWLKRWHLGDFPRTALSCLVKTMSNISQILVDIVKTHDLAAQTVNLSL